MAPAAGRVAHEPQKLSADADAVRRRLLLLAARRPLAKVGAAAGRFLRYAKYFDGIATAAERDRSHGLHVDVGVITHRL
jgi:hypothetical protein